MLPAGQPVRVRDRLFDGVHLHDVHVPVRLRAAATATFLIVRVVRARVVVAREPRDLRVEARRRRRGRRHALAHAAFTCTRALARSRLRERRNLPPLVGVNPYRTSTARPASAVPAAHTGKLTELRLLSH